MATVVDATKTAATGIFTSHGEDYTCYVDKGGNPIYWVNDKAWVFAKDFITTDGISLKEVQAEVQAGVPSLIDLGTF